MAFEPMDCRYLNTPFFTTRTPQLMELIDYYNLGILMNCTHDINIDLCKEFYVNLRQIGGDNRRYESTVGGTIIEFNPDSLQAFLQCRPSQNPFITFPNSHGIISGSFSHITIDTIHQHYFGSPRNPFINIFDHSGMSAFHYVWYRIILDCILPIVTRARSVIRMPHLIMMYALEHHLDIDIALNVFASITYYSTPHQGKFHMPFCHILTAFFASKGIDVTKGNIKKLKKAYDCIGSLQLKLAKIEFRDGGVFWERDRPQRPVNPVAEQGAADAEGPAAHDPEVPVPDPAPEPFDNRLARMEQRFDDYYGEFLSFRQDMRAELQTLTSGQSQILDMLRGLQMGQAPPPPPPDAED